MIKLTNEILEVSLNSKGAELQSIKKQQTEYLWHGDSKWWGRHSPVLFPIVGRLKDNYYIYQGKEYSMSQHGFARDLEFTPIKNQSTQATFQLTSSDQTLSIYPFHFKLTINYTLIDHEVHVEWIVENTDVQDIYFSIGAHPAFLLQGPMDDYTIHWTKPVLNQTISTINGLIDQTTDSNQLITTIPLHKDLFVNDALIYNQPIDSMTLSSSKHNHSVTVHFEHFPYVAIWAPYKREEQSPFVCIEPWYGIADSINTNHQLNEKIGIQTLKPNDTFQAKYIMSFN